MHIPTKMTKTFDSIKKVKWKTYDKMSISSQIEVIVKLKRGSNFEAVGLIGWPK